MGVPMWNFSFPYKLKQLIDLSCQRNMLFTFDGKRYGPSLDIKKAFVAFVCAQWKAAAAAVAFLRRIPSYEEITCRFRGGGSRSRRIASSPRYG
jgi:FMN-dependent NADH-azoreductase